MNCKVNLGINSYDIIIERGVLQNAGKHLDLNRKVLVVTDSGVPKQYADTIAQLCKEPVMVCVQQGEPSKNVDNWQRLLRAMLENNFTRTDCVTAVGGGVVGDMAGFAAACYMRGIDFYNIPTTVLSQVDSSVGGKTAIDFGQYKNMVGAFHQPKCVLIDPDVLATLPPRQIANGLAESVKMAATFDAALFERIERENVPDIIDDIIARSVELKKNVVEQDEKESGLRKVLNFGHTIGHAVESSLGLDSFLHGECVGFGMLPMCSDSVRNRLIPVLQKLGLPTHIEFDKHKVIEAIRHDKKFDGNNVTIVRVEEIGSYIMKKITRSELVDIIISLKSDNNIN
ncbi:MAG: 3-dehydroquinate synthase [Spirochaetales bacterium]|nr:3-dehydroquinate synthase [Spirochaetales bacterium]